MGTHDIYIYSNLKPLHGNRIAVPESSIPLPVPRAVFPARLSFRRLPLSSRREEVWGDCAHDQAADRAHDRISDRCVPFVPSPVPCLSPFPPSRLPRPSISLPFRHLISLSRTVVPSSSRSLITRPASLPAVSTSKAGRDGITAYSVSSSHVRRLDSWNVVERREKGKGRLVS